MEPVWSESSLNAEKPEFHKFYISWARFLVAMSSVFILTFSSFFDFFQVLRQKLWNSWHKFWLFAVLFCDFQRFAVRIGQKGYQAKIVLNNNILNEMFGTV